MKISATTARKINLLEDYGFQSVSIEAIDTNLFMLRNPATTTTIRKVESLDTASAYSALQYTVTDASIYRKNERVVIFANDGITRKGTAIITAIDTDNNKITIEIIKDFTTKAAFTPASNDKIQLKMDEFIKKGQLTKIKSVQVNKEILLLAAEDTESDNCAIEVEDSGKKKS